MAGGDIKICLGVTESHSGTDALGLKTKAEEKEDHYLINGSKMFTTGAHISDYIMLMARTTKEDQKKSYGISIFIVDLKTRGITVNRIKKVGLKALGTCEIFFEDVMVPKENLMGERDKGWYHLLDTLNNERIVIAVLCAGGAQAALNDAVQYAKERIVFDRPVGLVTPHIYFGYDKASNSDVWKTGDDNVTRTMVGTGINFKVADNFYMVPEFTYYDYGEKPNDAAKPDLGKEWLGGVQFQFVF